jgi:TonB family protein
MPVFNIHYAQRSTGATIRLMKRSAIWLFALLCGTIFGKDDRILSSLPERFLIARHTFVDVGPPTDFYEIISARGTASGTIVERVTLTPAGDACTQPASVEIAASSIPDPIRVVLEGRDPCVIPDKALRKELKRSKQGLVFSGAEISMHVQCGGKERIIQADVLDRDMFDRSASTPENTSWTMRFLARLDKAFSNGVWDRPIFAGVTQPAGATLPNGDAARALASGEYDRLFEGAPDRPSDMYRASQIRPPTPDVSLRSSVPFQPEKFVRPEYPPLARLARIEGVVVITFQVDADGGVTEAQFESGHPMLRPTVTNAVSGWKFPKAAVDHRIKATLDFKTNCSPKAR